MTPQERRAYLDRLADDLHAEIKAASAAFRPLEQQYSLAVNRLGNLKAQLKEIDQASLRFGPHNDPAVIEGTASVGMAEADLDDVLHGR